MKSEEICPLPTHLAIIMDGNGRWAEKRALVRKFGHRAGVKTLLKIVKYAFSIGISFVTVYAFSTENRFRPKDEVDALIDLIRKNFAGTFNVALNYGGRAEILRAAKLLSESGEEFSEHSFEKFLYTADQPEPDLILRTGGEKRLSNFLLYQSAYAELFFTDTLWPDFSEKELDSILQEYKTRNRRYGKV